MAECRGKAGPGADGPTVRVVTAEPISAELQVETAAKVRALVGEDVRVAFETDPALIGGIVVRLPDRTIDLSLARRFREYGRAVQELIGAHVTALEGWAKAGTVDGEASPGKG